MAVKTVYMCVISGIFNFSHKTIQYSKMSATLQPTGYISDNHRSS